MKNNFEAEILQTIRYFSFFNYPPTFTEIHTFLKKKTTKKSLASILEKMEGKKLIATRIFNFKKYTPPQYSITRHLQAKSKNNNVAMKPFSKAQGKQFNKWKKKYEFSQQKLHNLRFRIYIKLLSLFPQIQLIGLSGSVAMMNVNEKDDIDIFIISQKNRIWTARCISMLLAQSMGIRRKRRTYSRRPSQIGYKDKVCLNLFFDKSNLTVPKHKQTEYVAHEVLQMKPLVQRGDIYMRLIDANRWVFDIFPNAKSRFTQIVTQKNADSVDKLYHPRVSVSISDWIELLLKKFQLILINRHQTTEIITDTQLWFFPEDFEHKITKFRLE